MQVANREVSIDFGRHQANEHLEFIPENKGLSDTDAGYLKWHKGCPDDLLKFHEIYRKLL